MNNCLITKLKDSVNNPNLPVYGDFILNVNTGADPGAQHLRFEVSNVNVNLNGHPMADATHLSKGQYDVVLNSKYEMTKFIVGSGIFFDLNDLYGCVNMNNLAIYYTFGSELYNISIFSQMTKIQRFTVVNDNIIGDLSVLENIIPSLTTVDYMLKQSTGDVTLFKNALNMINFHIGDCLLHGRIEDIFEYWAVNTPVDKTIHVHESGGHPDITYNNASFEGGNDWYYQTRSTGCAILDYNNPQIIKAEYNKTTNTWTYNQ